MERNKPELRPIMASWTNKWNQKRITTIQISNTDSRMTYNWALNFIQTELKKVINTIEFKWEKILKKLNRD